MGMKSGAQEVHEGGMSDRSPPRELALAHEVQALGSFPSRVAIVDSFERPALRSSRTT